MSIFIIPNKLYIIYQKYIVLCAYILSANTKLMFKISFGKYLMEAYYESYNIILERTREG